MADISQVKLPNGDTYNLVDETSGYGKSHVVTLSENGDGYQTNVAFNQMLSWISNNEIVILQTVYSDTYYLREYDDTHLTFATLYGYGVRIASNGITYLPGGWITLNDLPIYDGTVV